MKIDNHKRAIIVGATSGIGRAYARILIEQGWTVGIAGRRTQLLEELRSLAPNRIFTKTIDVQADDAAQRLEQLIESVGGMDLYFHASGIGKLTMQLSADQEAETLKTNGVGFVRLVSTAFDYFSRQGSGHIAAITSVAGTRGIGLAAAYSASKRFQSTYLDALEQLAHTQKLRIAITDIRPGFVETAFLANIHTYPFVMNVETVATSIHHALERRKRIAIIDWKYRIIVYGWHLIPKWLWKHFFRLFPYFNSKV